MNDLLLDLFRHNAWANRRLIEFCSGLTSQQLGARIAGSYGSVAETIQHVIGGEAFYLFLLSESYPDWPGFDETRLEPERWSEWTDDLAAFWESFLSGPLDPERLIVDGSDEGEKVEVRASVLIAQALYHGNIHREQVCAISTSLGLAPPDLEAWAYGTAVGRHVIHPA